jgi:hypothetical protein
MDPEQSDIKGDVPPKESAEGAEVPMAGRVI